MCILSNATFVMMVICCYLKLKMFMKSCGYFPGECLCEEGLGGCDCSNDLNQPPLLQGILDNGLCDELDMPCTTAYIFGHFFTDNDNLTCKFIRFEVCMYRILTSFFGVHVLERPAPCES